MQQHLLNMVRKTLFYNEHKIDEAWHLGMDWASSKRADIIVTNPGKVIYKGLFRIYGNTVIIDHGLGLGSLYAHTSSINVEVGNDVKTGDKIGNTWFYWCGVWRSFTFWNVGSRN